MKGEGPVRRDEVLREALAPVLSDLGGAGVALPRIEEADWTGDPGVPSAMLWSRDGSGTGISVRRSAPAYDRVATVADQVQGWVIEELWGSAPTNWPPCPHHPSNHPLAATTHDGTAVWACPLRGAVVAPIGGLGPA